MREAEKAGVIAKIKEAIKVYEISPRELFGSSAGPTKKSKSKFGQAPKFSDGKGNTWVGRGPRPVWLRDSLAAGKKLEDFAHKPNGAAGPAKVDSKAGAKKAGTKKVSATPKKTGTKAAKKMAAKKTAKIAKKVLPPKFKDDAGNTWSGRGSQPRWLKDALAAGKKLEELRA